MTVMTICGVIGSDAVIKEISGKKYFQLSVAHRNGKEDTVWVRVLIPNFEQDSSGFVQGRRIVVFGRPIFGCYEGRATVTLWSDRYEVQ